MLCIYFSLQWFKHWTHSRDLLKVADMFFVKKERSEARLALRTWSLWAKGKLLGLFVHLCLADTIK